MVVLGILRAWLSGSKKSGSGRKPIESQGTAYVLQFTVLLCVICDVSVNPAE